MTVVERSAQLATYAVFALILSVVFVLFQPQSADAVPARLNGPVDVVVQVTNLPAEFVPEVFLVAPVPGGGYQRLASLGRLEARPYKLEAGSFLELTPFSIGQDTALYPKPRFQQVDTATNGILRVQYVRQFLLTIGKWSTGTVGGGGFGVVHGDVSIDSQWVDEHTVITAIARPHAGARFSHWGVFAGGESVDKGRHSGTAPTIQIRVDHPTTLVAGFLGN